MNKFRTTVKCDYCDWKSENQYPEDWLGVLCPKCRKVHIINDQDMETVRHIDLLRAAGIAFTKEDEIPEGTEVACHVTIDTAELHNTKRCPKKRTVSDIVSALSDEDKSILQEALDKG